MERYGIPEGLVQEALSAPDSIVRGHGSRRVAQKRLDGYVLRVVFEEHEDLRVVVTVYKAKSLRYEI